MAKPRRLRPPYKVGILLSSKIVEPHGVHTYSACARVSICDLRLKTLGDGVASLANNICPLYMDFFLHNSKSCMPFLLCILLIIFPSMKLKTFVALYDGCYIS
jgi:hypothetical protein